MTTSGRCPNIVNCSGFDKIHYDDRPGSEHGAFIREPAPGLADHPEYVRELSLRV